MFDRASVCGGCGNQEEIWLIAKHSSKSTSLQRISDSKARDLCDLLAKHGKEVTVQKALEPAEFDVLFDTLTGQHQIRDIGDYLEGKSCIPSKKKPAKKKEEAAAKAAPAPAKEPPKQEAAKPAP